MENNEDIKIVEHLLEYLQLKIDDGVHKIQYNELLHDEKTIDCLNATENLLSRLKTAENKLNRYERECRMFRSFCRRIRKTEKRNVDDYNYGREFAYIQFLNLIDGEIGWEYEGKHFDEADKEIKEWARKKVEENV